MIPTHWQPVHRPDDGELVGYLTGQDAAVTPVNLFGHPLSEPIDQRSARTLLERDGLASLGEVWTWSRADGDLEVRVLSAFPDRVVVIEAPYGIPWPGGQQYELPVPCPDLRPYRRP